MSLANISIVGNLAREPEQYKFASGRVKTTLVVAVNTFNKLRKEKTTDFYRVETWDRLADLARTYLKKGNQVAVSGRLAMERWIDRDGKDRVTPTVQANQLSLPPRSRPDPTDESAISRGANAPNAAEKMPVLEEEELIAANASDTSDDAPEPGDDILVNIEDYHNADELSEHKMSA